MGNAAEEVCVSSGGSEQGAKRKHAGRRGGPKARAKGGIPKPTKRGLLEAGGTAETWAEERGRAARGEVSRAGPPPSGG